MFKKNNENIILTAGAGTGKTHALVEEYIVSLLGFDGCNNRKMPENVFAVTFTEKAAAEMRIRINNRLLKLSNSEHLINDSIFIKSKKLGCNWPNNEKLKNLVQNLPEAPICTFHSLCIKILRNYAIEAKIQSNFSLLNPRSEIEILNQIAEEIVLDALDEKNKTISMIVSRFNISGVGRLKGLTDLLVGLYMEICEHGILVENISFAGFNNKYNIKKLISEISECFNKYLNVELSSKSKEKIEEALLYFEKVKFVLCKKEQYSEIIISKAFHDFRKSIKGLFGPVTLRQNLVIACVNLGSFLCFKETKLEVENIKNLIIKFDKKIENKKNILGKYGFNDLLKLTSNLLKMNLNVRRDFKKKIFKLLVDEFQDTSPLQEDILALLAEEKSFETKLLLNERAMGNVKLEPNLLFIVGDPRQSIYGFRGADVKLFQHTLDVVTNGNSKITATGKQKILLKCRRSQKSIVNLINIVAKSILRLNKYGILFKSTNNLLPVRKDFGVCGAIWKVIIEEKEDIVKVQAIVIANQIKKLIFESNGKINFSDIAILVRRIKYAQSISFELKRLNIFNKVFGGDDFYSKSEVMDIICALKLIIDPGCDIASFAVLRSPFILFPDYKLPNILNVLGKKTLNWLNIINNLDNCDLNIVIKDRITNFEKLRQFLRKKLFKYNLGQIISCLIEQNNFLLSLIIRKNSSDKISNVQKLKNKCYELKENSYDNIEYLWNMLRERPKEDSLISDNEEINFIKIMTIHQSKGLEYPIVIIADTLSSIPIERDSIMFDPDEGLAISTTGRPIFDCAPKTQKEKLYAPTPIDLVRKTKKERSEAELARLLYVALTRARDYIFFVAATKKNGKDIGKGLTLLKLMRICQEHEKILFDELLPSIKINIKKEKKEKTINNIVVKTLGKDQNNYTEIMINNKTYISVTKLIEKMSVNQQFPKLLQYEKKINLSNIKKTELGSLAHKLIATVSTQLSFNQSLNIKYVKNMLNAALHSLGIVGNKEINSILKRCLYTIVGPIRELLNQGATLNFEEAISFNKGNFHIEGYADLVVRSSLGILVVDFKSSKISMSSKKTKIQLYIYAQSLLNNAKCPIFISSCLIGDSRKLIWHKINNLFLKKMFMLYSV